MNSNKFIPNFKSQNQKNKETVSKIVASGIIGIGLAYAIPKIKEKME
ncbi:MAG TPA: hypothetical protein VK087_03670 [Tissierellaceae bacterium]|nr:hypothetical protein [Tissierellaceae bacterium]